MKKCTQCKLEFTVDMFSKCLSRKDGLQHRCIECNRKYYQLNKERVKEKNILKSEEIKKYQKEWYQKNSEKKRKYALEYRKNNPDKIKQDKRNWELANNGKAKQYKHERRARMRANKTYYISPKEINKIYSSPCAYCGAIGQVELEHIIPISRGGSHGIGNIISACPKCNRSKKDRLIVEWRKATRL